MSVLESQTDRSSNREFISRFRTAVPDILKDQLETTLQQTFTTEINASVIKPLERTLLMCKEEAAASYERATGGLSKSHPHMKAGISTALQSFSGQQLEWLTNVQQTLQRVSVKVDHIDTSNHERDGRENSLSTMISEYQGKIRKLQTTWHNMPQLAAGLDVLGAQGGEGDDLSIAFIECHCSSKSGGEANFLGLMWKNRLT